MKMKQEGDLLQAISDGAQMGVQGISQMDEIGEKGPFFDEIRREKNEYQGIADRAEEEMRNLGLEPKKLGMMAKMGSYVSTEANTAMDNSVPHLAEMMIQGTTMGYTKLTRQRAEAEKSGIASQNSLNLASELLTAEEKNTAALRNYLK